MSKNPNDESQEDDGAEKSGGSEDSLQQNLTEAIDALPDIKGPVSPDEFKKLVAQILNTTIELERHETRSTRFSGPVPPPEWLAEYEATQPGMADRLVGMAEKEQGHRHSLDNEQARFAHRELTHSAVKTYVGQAAGIVITLVVVLCGTSLIGNGKNAEGLTAIILALVSLVGVFVVGKIVDRQKPDDTPEE